MFAYCNTKNAQILTWAESIAFFNSFYWSGHILLFIILVVVTLMPYPAKPKHADHAATSDTSKSKEAKVKNA